MWGITRQRVANTGSTSWGSQGNCLVYIKMNMYVFVEYHEFIFSCILCIFSVNYVHCQLHLHSENLPYFRLKLGSSLLELVTCNICTLCDWITPTLTRILTGDANWCLLQHQQKLYLKCIHQALPSNFFSSFNISLQLRENQDFFFLICHSFVIRFTLAYKFSFLNKYLRTQHNTSIIYSCIVDVVFL